MLSASLIGWSVANFYAATGPQNYETITTIRIVIFFVVLQNTLFCIFTNIFPTNRIKHISNWTATYICFSLIVCFTALSPYLFTGVMLTTYQASPIPGPGIILFVIHAGLSIIAGFYFLVRTYKKAGAISRTQLKYVIVASVILWIVVPCTNFVLPLVINTNIFAKFSSVYTLAYSALIAYVIVRHKFLDIKAVVARSVAYVLLIGTISVLFGGLLLAAYALILGQPFTFNVQQLINLTLVLLVAFAFEPLKRFFERATDRLFFRNYYNSEQLLNELGKLIVSEFYLDNLLTKTLQKICHDISISGGEFIILQAGAVYKRKIIGSIQYDDISLNVLNRFKRKMYVTDELDDGYFKRTMDTFGIRVIFSIRTNEEFVGYLILGDKLSGDIYTSQDIEVLSILVNELAVAISNAKANEEISHFNATLQEKVETATRGLREANIRLKELDKAKDEFISMASHQLRTPLTTIKGYLSMMEEGDAGPLTKTQKDFVSAAYGGSQRMVNLISDLLNVSRMSAGKFLIEKTPIDLAKVSAEEVAQLQTHAKAKNLVLTFIAPNEPLPLIALDENKTRQVLMNFIDNAIYYTAAGRVDVTLERQKDRVVLKVTDTGIGVPEDAKKKLFAKFFRAGNAQNIRPDGTGLGLFLAKRVIEDQGGTVLFESTEGTGSMFGFSMPLK